MRHSPPGWRPDGPDTRCTDLKGGPGGADGSDMAQAHALTTAAPQAPPTAVPVRPTPLAPIGMNAPLRVVTEPLSLPPSEWDQVTGVTVGNDTIDLVLIGPNGVFSVHLDPDPGPAAVRPGHGLFHTGVRVPAQVKRALRNTQDLRDRLASVPGGIFPYPVLVASAAGEAGHRLGRLMVVRPGRLAEAVWRHDSRPLTRSDRLAVGKVLQHG